MILDKKIQGIVITSCCRVEERKIIVACIYFAWRCDVVKKKNRYRLLVRIVVNRRGWEWHVFILYIGVMLWREKKDTGYHISDCV